MPGTPINERCAGGSNAAQELGLGSSAPASEPSPTQLTTTGVLEISTRAQNSCLRTATSVRCWGPNDFGQIGDGTQSQRNQPTLVSGIGQTLSISVGGGFACALMPDRTVRCWGTNAQGQLGIGSSDQLRTTPAQVQGLTDVAQIATGTAHACALKIDGSVWCWGWNSDGQLSGMSGLSRFPVGVSALQDMKSIGLGNYHSCAVSQADELYCWGRGAQGQIGDGTLTSAQRTPVKLSLVNVLKVSAGASHTCAVMENGALRCWGENSDGQLGNGSTNLSSSPVLVGGLSGISSVSGGAYHTCATRTNGQLYCWGRSDFGQIGDGATTRRLSPVQIF